MLAGLVLTGCGVKKSVQKAEITEQKPEVPAWHTCLIQGARATVTTDEDRVSATVTMQTVRDSMLVISVMPMFGIEMLRIEATPTEMTAIDKIHGQYARATYAELNTKLTPAINWDILQQLCSAELPTGNEKARLQYQFEDETIELVITYPERQLDVPVRVQQQRKDNYTQIEVSNLL